MVLVFFALGTPILCACWVVLHTVRILLHLCSVFFFFQLAGLTCPAFFSANSLFHMTVSTIKVPYYILFLTLFYSCGISLQSFIILLFCYHIYNFIHVLFSCFHLSVHMIFLRIPYLDRVVCTSDLQRPFSLSLFNSFLFVCLFFFYQMVFY